MRLKGALSVVLFPAMRLWKRRIPFALLLVGAMLAILPVLAFFQYRWLGQVSQAERERMLGNLRHSVLQFREDFDRDLSRVFLHFQSRQPLAPEEIPARYATLLADWKAKAPNPKLIKELYWVDATRAPELELHRLEAGQAPKIEWPAEFENWRNRVKDQDGTRQTGLQAFQFLLSDLVRQQSTTKQTDIVISESRVKREKESHAPVVRMVGKPGDAVFAQGQRIIAESPALVIPILRPAQGAAVTETTPRSDFIIAKLDLEYLSKEAIPALVRKHFQTDRGLDYQVAVLTRLEPRKVIYQSSPTPIADIASSNDASSGILALRPEHLGGLLQDHLAMASGLKEHLLTADRVTMRVVAGSRDKVPSSTSDLAADLDSHWQIFLKHKAGSLEAAVGSVRRRSIGISLGVLALLGTSIILLLISTRRAQRLAEQQIDFVAGVSHELRTPLAVIRSAAENLADGYIEDRDHIRRYGALIRDEGRRLTDMVEQVLEVAGVQSGRREYQLRPVDPREIAQQAIDGCNLLISESAFEIDLQMDSRLPMINADVPALVRGVQNVISNAIKYSGSKRQLRIRLGTEKSDLKEEVRIEIEDFGLGISAADLPHIFEPFFRGRDVVNAQIHGSGLGLSLVKHIIESHGGRIIVRSAPGNGTTFILLLPAAGPAQREESVVEGYEQTNPAH